MTLKGKKQDSTVALLENDPRCSFIIYSVGVVPTLLMYPMTTEDSMSDFNLNDHVFRLLQAEPFFAALSRRIEKKASTAVPTAGVRVDEHGYFEMIYNPAFFAGLTDEQRTGVLVHEFYHLVFEHVTGRLPDELAGAMHGQPTPEQRQKFKIWNIAADLSINYHIGAANLPENCCIPGGKMFEDMPGDMTAEWYYDKLLQKMEDQEQNGEGEQGDGNPDGSDGSGGPGGSGTFDPDAAGQFDSHDDWNQGEANEATQQAVDIAKERLKEAVRDSAQEAASKGWGTVTASCRKEIIERVTSKVDWRKVMRYFVKTSQRASKRSTPKRLNRRYAYVHPGRKVNRTANIAVSIDQSGSVSDSMLAAFYGELNKLADIATFTVVPFDTQVAESKVFEWKKGQTHPQKRYMHGGTCFNAPTEYVNKGKFDGHIILTDMEAPKPKASKCQRMWMTTTRCAQRPYFQTNERIVAIDE
jgi:predicted metal-dependent peptidase